MLSSIVLKILKNDPEEMNDLAEKEEYAEKVKSLFKDLIALQKKMGDKLDLNEIYEQL